MRSRLTQGQKHLTVNVKCHSKIEHGHRFKVSTLCLIKLNNNYRILNKEITLHNFCSYGNIL